jgi:hypothetical protein
MSGRGGDTAVKKKLKPVNDNDPQYLVYDENGEPYDWFIAGIEDYANGKGDLGVTIGKHMRRAERKGLLPKPIRGGTRP